MQNLYAHGRLSSEAAGSGVIMWEYKMVVIVGNMYSEEETFYDSDNAIHINRLGEQGWELVTVMPHAQHFKRAYFKRPITLGSLAKNND